mgnify:CR=1 FL=1
MRLAQHLTSLIFSLFSLIMMAQTPSPDIENYQSITLDLAANQLQNQEYKSAIQTLDEVLKRAQNQNDKNKQYSGYSILGNVYLSLQDTIKSRDIFEKALVIAQELKNDTLLASSYNDLGKLYASSEEYQEKAIAYLQRNIALIEKLDGSDKSLAARINLATLYLKQENYDEAYPALMQAKFASLRDSLDRKSRARVLTLLGRYYTSSNQETLAEDAFMEAIDISFSEGLVAEEEEAQKHLAKYFEAAYYHSQRQLQLANEVFKNESQKELQVASAQFYSRENERDLEIATKEKELLDQVAESSLKTTTALLFASSILLVALFIIFTLYRARKQNLLRLREKNKQLEKAKNDAEELSKLKTQFFSTISHELRTPLYGVIGIASILLEDTEVNKHRHDLRSLKFSADYLLALINDVLLMSKMEAKNIKLEHTPFKLNTLLRSITHSFEFSLEQNNNKLHLEIDKDLPNQLVGDSVRLSQILMNLIGNAIKFNENGNIWVRIKKESITPDGLYRTAFVIEDDGMGIPKKSQQSVFEEFSQVENKNYNYQGTGLGLPIVKKLLALYGSDITLVSEEGKGATFSFVINLEKATGIAAIEQQQLDAIESVHTLQGAHLLVVDDNRINQKITQKLLENKGFTCDLASDGIEAVTMAQKEAYDLILMDIHMPKKDGVEATKDIRKFDTDIPIIALTAVEIDEIRHKIYKAGMDDILVKPYDVSQFLSVILRNIKNKKAQTVLPESEEFLN